MKNVIVKTITLFSILTFLISPTSAEAFLLKTATQGIKFCAYATFTALVLDTYIYPEKNRQESSIEAVIKSCDAHYKKFKNFATTQPEPATIVNNIIVNATSSLETLNKTEMVHDAYAAVNKVAAWLRSQKTS